MHACFGQQLSDSQQVSLHWQLVTLQGTAASGSNSSFLRAFPVVALNSLSFGSLKQIDASERSSIVELRFLDGPLLFVLALSWLLTFRTQFLAVDDRVLSLLAFLLAVTRDHMNQSGDFLFDIANCEEIGL